MLPTVQSGRLLSLSAPNEPDFCKILRDGLGVPAVIMFGPEYPSPSLSWFLISGIYLDAGIFPHIRPVQEQQSIVEQQPLAFSNLSV